MEAALAILAVLYLVTGVWLACELGRRCHEDCGNWPLTLVIAIGTLIVWPAGIASFVLTLLDDYRQRKGWLDGK
jgi:hypothetical protein